MSAERMIIDALIGLLLGLTVGVALPVGATMLRLWFKRRRIVRAALAEFDAMFPEVK